MTETVKCTYDSAYKLKNALEDLIGTGIPQENIRIEDDTNQIIVTIPATARPEILEILNRHEPSTID